MIYVIVASGLILLLLVVFIIVVISSVFVQWRRRKLSVTLNQGVLRC